MEKSLREKKLEKEDTGMGELVVNLGVGYTL